MATGTRAEITLKFSVNLDLVPGWGDCAQDWIELIRDNFLNQQAYKPEADLIKVSYTERK
jgi:hypothetical protein